MWLAFKLNLLMLYRFIEWDSTKREREKQKNEIQIRQCVFKISASGCQALFWRAACLFITLTSGFDSHWLNKSLSCTRNATLMVYIVPVISAPFSTLLQPRWTLKFLILNVKNDIFCMFRVLTEQNLRMTILSVTICRKIGIIF